MTNAAKLGLELGRTIRKEMAYT